MSLQLLFSLLKERDYKKEYEEYHSLPKQKKRRAGRNYARRKLMKTGRVKKGDGMDVDHVDFDPLNKASSNFRVRTAKFNRGRKK